jgi:hypothetical protein
MWQRWQKARMGEVKAIWPAPRDVVTFTVKPHGPAFLVIVRTPVHMEQKYLLQVPLVVVQKVKEFKIFFFWFINLFRRTPLPPSLSRINTSTITRSIPIRSILIISSHLDPPPITMAARSEA